MASSKTDGRRFDKTRKASKFIGSWITPWGFLRQIFRTEFQSMKLTNESVIDNPLRYQQDNRILLIASATVACLSIALLVWTIKTSEAQSGFSGLSLLASAGILISLVKLSLAINNRAVLKEYLKKNSPAQSDHSPDEESDDIQTTDLDAALLLIATFRNMFILVTLFGLGVFFYPSTFSRSLNLFELYNDSFISGLVVFLIILISAFLLLRALIAHRDLKSIRGLGAKARSHGYVTANNSVYSIVQTIILMMLIAYIGDLVMRLVVDLSMHYLLMVVIKIAVFAILIIYGIQGYKSATNIANMRTGKTPPSPLLLLAFRSSYLPEPGQDQKTEDLPPVKIIALISLMAAIVIAGNSNYGSILVCVASLMPMALLVAIDQFHAEVKQYD